MSDQALRDAIARAINAADGGPANADDWSRQAADAVLGLVAEQIARERAELAHGVQYAKGYQEALGDAEAAIEALPLGEHVGDPRDPAWRPTGKREALAALDALKAAGS